MKIKITHSKPNKVFNMFSYFLWYKREKYEGHNLFCTKEITEEISFFTPFSHQEGDYV